jgi:hypothetical protein
MMYKDFNFVEHEGELAPIKSYTIKELMWLYGHSRYIMNGILTGLDDRLRKKKGQRHLNLRQVKILFEEEGRPTVPVSKKKDIKHP